MQFGGYDITLLIVPFLRKGFQNNWNISNKTEEESELSQTFLG